jgi:Fe-S oxidoreductase
MLGRAKRLLNRTLDALRYEVESGIPIVGLEPSCVAVFRDEMPQLLPDDPLAHRMAAQTHFFTEFLAHELDGAKLPTFARKALVHGHCHHKSVLDFDAEKTVLSRLGLECDMPETGCCGLAGSFGFEERHYDVSMRAGERVLFPAVRDVDLDTLIVTDGFSCREQIEHGTGRRPLHIAEVVKLAMEQRTR